MNEDDDLPDDPFTIWGQYRGLAPEKIDSARDERSANYLASEYRMAYGPGWRIWTTEQGD